MPISLPTDYVSKHRDAIIYRATHEHTWTKEQADAFIVDVALKFVSYNQYMFNFTGEKSGYIVEGRIGGEYDDIRSEHIYPEQPATSMWELRIIDSNGAEVYLDIDTYRSSVW
jgi:hypothetical protein